MNHPTPTVSVIVLNYNGLRFLDAEGRPLPDGGGALERLALMGWMREHIEGITEQFRTKWPDRLEESIHWR